MIIYTQDIKMDKAGHIIVDEYQNTNAKNIYALGDVCGKALLTPGNNSPSSMYKLSLPQVIALLTLGRNSPYSR